MSTEKELQAAINQKCLECCCGSHGEVRDCKIRGCALHQYRPYQRAASGVRGGVDAAATRTARGVQVSVFDVLVAGGIEEWSETGCGAG